MFNPKERWCSLTAEGCRDEPRDPARVDRGHYDLADTQVLQMLAKVNRVRIRTKPNEGGIDALLTSEHNRRWRAHNVNGCAGTDKSCAKVASSRIVDDKNIEAGKLES